jgi:MYXO-CTERM domain-containing protein
VCCNRRCDDFCEACDQTGRVGTCSPYTMGIDPEEECPIGSVCNGGHGCMIAPDAGVEVGFDGGTGGETRGCSCRAATPSGPGAGSALVALAVTIAAARRRRTPPAA